MFVLRHCYHITRSEAAKLPAWELRLLVAAGRSLLGLDGDASGEMTDADVQRAILREG